MNRATTTTWSAPARCHSRCSTSARTASATRSSAPASTAPAGSRPGARSSPPRRISRAAWRDSRTDPTPDKINLGGSFYIGVQEEVKPDGTQLGYIEDTVGAEFGLVGEKYGWMVEIDPTRPARPGEEAHRARPLPPREHRGPRRAAATPSSCYMGDDRRGGHWWKFVSKAHIKDRKRPSNSTLFEEGTLLRRTLQRGRHRRVDPAAARARPTNPTAVRSVSRQVGAAAASLTQRHHGRPQRPQPAPAPHRRRRASH